jgi:mannose-6-phosphate isomerase-like protein (cupin superfamily)
MDGRVMRAEESGPFKASGLNNNGRLDFFVLDVDYAFWVPLHTHAVQEDTFFVVDGVLTLQLDDDVLELVPGDFATAPPGVAHSFTNARVDQPPVRLVNLMTPGLGFDRYLEQVMAGADEATANRLNQEYGVQMIGPPLAVTLGLSAN